MSSVIRAVIELLLLVFIGILVWVVVQSKQEATNLSFRLAGAEVELKASAEKLAITEEKLAQAELKLEKAAKGELWEYEGRFGPKFWGSFFPLCANGKSQAPLDIKGPFARSKTKIKVEYRLSSLRIVNNGHTLQVNVSPGSRLFVDGVPHELIQFHFHKPSEEWIDGKSSEMSLHLVHKSPEGRFVVLGVLFQTMGADNAGLTPIWAHMPNEVGPEQAFPETNVDPSKLLPSTLGFYQYEGSLTTPPCSEGVTFFILRMKMPISKSQLDAFPLRHPNARPIQPINGRTISISD